MSRALGPRPSLAPGGTAAGWAVLATCWGLAALAALIWAAARIAAALTGGTVDPVRAGLRHRPRPRADRPGVAAHLLGRGRRGLHRC